MQTKEEIWKDIKGYEGQYQVSNLGRVRSLNYRKTGQIKVLSLLKVSNGYSGVYLGHKNLKLVHRLVAQTFILNPNNYPIINHKDCNRQNNVVTNLEWCTYKYNNNYADAIEKRIKKQSKQVVQMSLNGQIITIWPSINEAVRQNDLCRSGIIQCCQNKINKYKGYKWEYV